MTNSEKGGQRGGGPKRAIFVRKSLLNGLLMFEPKLISSRAPRKLKLER